MKKPNKNKYFFSEEVIGTGFDLYIGNPEEFEKDFSEKLEPHREGLCHHEIDKNGKMMCGVYLKKPCLTTYCHELIHVLFYQLSHTKKIPLSQDSHEVYAYIMEYYVSLYLKNVEGKNLKR